MAQPDLSDREQVNGFCFRAGPLERREAPEDQVRESWDGIGLRIVGLTIDEALTSKRLQRVWDANRPEMAKCEEEATRGFLRAASAACKGSEGVSHRHVFFLDPGTRDEDSVRANTAQGISRHAFAPGLPTTR